MRAYWNVPAAAKNEMRSGFLTLLAAGAGAYVLSVTFVGPVTTFPK